MLFGKLQRDPDCDYEKGSIAQVNVLAIVAFLSILSEFSRMIAQE